ncbi:MAG: hypothetical protein AAFQ82_22465 [Myxococcota bacterium]
MNRPRGSDERAYQWRQSMRYWNRVFKSGAFWAYGLTAGCLGIVGCWFWVEGVYVYRLLIGIHFFFYLWLGVGVLAGRRAVASEDHC